MSDTPKVYQKDDSFIEIRQNDPDQEAVYVRIRRLMRELDNYQLSDYPSRVIRQACDDILGGPSSGPEPRFHLQDYVIQEIIRVRDEDLPRYLFYRYRYEIFPKKKILDEFPPCLQIEPTFICNYRCVFCYQTDTEFTQRKNGYMGMMSLSLFKKMIDQAEGECEAVALASRGEPLICPDIEEMLACASGKFLALKVNTK